MVKFESSSEQTPIYLETNLERAIIESLKDQGGVLNPEEALKLINEDVNTFLED